MDLDPIVMLAYISVSLNVIIVIAAVVTYGVFWLKRRARRRSPQQVTGRTAIADTTPIFLKRYVPPQRSPVPLTATNEENRLIG